MKKLIKPPHLKKGDKVGIVSPSSTIAYFPRRFSRGVEELKSLGLKVTIGKNAKKAFGHNAGTPEERADDINKMFLDKTIKAIICSTGGFNANAVLPLLDYDMIEKNPKIFCGYSDITALNIAIMKKTGLVTFNGPTLLPTFGEYGGLVDFTSKFFKKALFSNKPIGTLISSNKFSDENLWWETEDNRSSVMKKAAPMRTICEGFAEGILIGGNLNTLCILVGTEYFPDLAGAILFLEEEGEGTAYLERKLNYLEQVGVLNKIKGLIYARPYQFITDSKDRNIYDILRYFGERHGFPIVADADFGHTDPMVTLPLGVRVTLNATNNPKIIITESATK
jgi:muramoyltetrapeptide carboxypeptidase